MQILNLTHFILIIVYIFNMYIFVRILCIWQNCLWERSFDLLQIKILIPIFVDMNLPPPHWAIAFPLSKGPKNAHFICIVGGRWFGFFFIDSLYYIHTYIGDTAQNSRLIYVCTASKKNYPKKLDKTAKIARDYAENAPKALVIYRFRTDDELGEQYSIL